MIRFLKTFKVFYIIYNLFNKKKLSHNVKLYKKYGIKKCYFSGISSKDFEHLPHQDRVLDLNLIRNSEFYKSLSDENKNSVELFPELGFCILKNFLSCEEADEINQEIDNLLLEKKISFRYKNKLMFVLNKSKKVFDIGNNSTLVSFLSTLMNGKAKLFQSINFINGSEQKTHSDSIHMTTYPLGGLIGLWIALEDIDAKNGALHYIPKSHLLPYFLNKDYGNEGTKMRIGKKGYREYENFITQKVKELNLKTQVFNAKKGDALIWHANILHGGEPHLDKNRTRKSMVFHYFDENSICYHEVTERPALFEI